MSRRDRILPVAALGVLLALGLLVLALVMEAASSGREALEDSLVAEVQAIARSQNTAVEQQLAGGAELIRGLDWELTVGSEADAAELQELLDLLSTLRSGFFLTDADGTVTQGVHLLDDDVIGEPLERAGFDQFLAAPAAGALLPVDEGITTDVPNTALVIALGQRSFEGAFIFESEVTADSAFNEEIAQLSRGDTGEYKFFDSNGVVIASNDPSALGRQVDPALHQARDGLQDIGGDVAVLADVPAAGWRIAFTQDRDEFESGLAGPLQQVGTITVVVFVLIGIATFFALSRRLQAAHEEQERLRRLAETQEEFISIVSHELRTPVAGVLGFLQTTIDHWDVMTDTERSGAVLRAASNARRLQSLTRDVLDSQSVESGRMTYSMNPADLREEVEVALEAARALYPNQRFESHLEASTAPAQLDVDRIQQVLTNLIDNAVRISPPDEPIELRLETSDGVARVAVRDHGPGLPAELQDRIFEKFVRGRTGAVTGTGLGLYIARQILEAHGGSISVESQPGQGATFTVELPLSVPAPTG